MAITPFKYQPMFPLGEDTTEYYLLTKDYVSVSEFEGKPILKIEKEGLTAMANAAFRDVSFMLRRSHNEHFLSVKTPVRQSFTERKASKSGRDIAMKKLSPSAFTKPIPRKTCATPKTRPLPCTTR